MADTRTPIPPPSSRWQPSEDPSSITVPGLDTSASITDQIDQIEQLITIKLQNVDENFSKIQNILASKLLPAVKRYAVGTEPVREAAKFWTSFYEQAAQIRIPTVDDYSVNDIQFDSEESGVAAATQGLDDQSGIERHREHHDNSTTDTESSFMPAQAAISSTPAQLRGTKVQDNFTPSDSVDPSWTRSMESPLVRLSREVHNLTLEDYAPPALSSKNVSVSDTGDTSKEASIHDSILPRSEKGNAKQSATPLRHSVLRRELYNGMDSFSPLASTSSPWSKSNSSNVKSGTPLPKDLNPYLPPGTDPAKWSGIVDLRDPSAHTPRRFRSTKRAFDQNPSTPDRNTFDDDDDSWSGLPEGMSPPVLLSPALPRSAAKNSHFKLGQTPSKEASARITQALVRDIQLKSGGRERELLRNTHQRSGVESSMSTVPTPPSLSRYQLHDTDTSESIMGGPSLDSMMRRVGLDIPSKKMPATPGLRLRPRSDRITTTSEPTSGPSRNSLQDEKTAPPVPPLAPLDYADTADDNFYDSDSPDEVNNTAHPSAAFLMASQGVRGSDDSFVSSSHSSDSLSGEDDANLGLMPVQPFVDSVENDGFDDDSFDSHDGGPPSGATESLFGPGQRPMHPDGGLRMLGEDLLQDTIGRGEQLALVGHVEDSPTPASWNNPRG